MPRIWLLQPFLGGRQWCFGLGFWQIFIGQFERFLKGKGVAILFNRIWEIYHGPLEIFYRGVLVGSWLCSCYFLWHRVGGSVTWACLSIQMEGLRWSRWKDSIWGLGYVGVVRYQGGRIPGMVWVSGWAVEMLTGGRSILSRRFSLTCHWIRW